MSSFLSRWIETPKSNEYSEESLILIYLSLMLCEVVYIAFFLLSGVDCAPLTSRGGVIDRSNDTAWQGMGTLSRYCGTIFHVRGVPLCSFLIFYLLSLGLMMGRFDRDIEEIRRLTKKFTALRLEQVKDKSELEATKRGSVAMASFFTSDDPGDLAEKRLKMAISLALRVKVASLVALAVATVAFLTYQLVALRPNETYPDDTHYFCDTVGSWRGDVAWVVCQQANRFFITYLFNATYVLRAGTAIRIVWSIFSLWRYKKKRAYLSLITDDQFDEFVEQASERIQLIDPVAVGLAPPVVDADGGAAGAGDGAEVGGGGGTKRISPSSSESTLTQRRPARARVASTNLSALLSRLATPAGRQQAMHTTMQMQMHHQHLQQAQAQQQAHAHAQAQAQAQGQGQGQAQQQGATNVDDLAQIERLVEASVKSLIKGRLENSQSDEEKRIIESILVADPRDPQGGNRNLLQTPNRASRALSDAVISGLEQVFPLQDEGQRGDDSTAASMRATLSPKDISAFVHAKGVKLPSPPEQKVE